MLDGEGQQIEALANLLSDWKLSDALRNRDWRRFAAKYNGPNALNHGYDKKLRAAFEHQCPSFLEYGEYPYVSADEIKKALKLKAAFSNMLDQMQ